MHTVCSKATVTLVAALSSTSHGGLFSARSHQFKFQYRNGEVDLISMVPAAAMRHCNEPISMRAWTLQEQLVSTRTLTYGTQDVIWRCHENTSYAGAEAASDHDKLYPPTPWAGPDNPLDVDRVEADDALWCLPRFPEPFDWGQVCDAFNDRHLSVASDKLPVLSALAREYHLRTGERYLAGLWGSEAGLRNDSQLLLQEDARVYKDYVAPSWSWVSIHG
jgi:hypothetical protein